MRALVLRVLPYLVCLAAILSARAAPSREPAPEPVGSVRQLYDGALTPDQTVATFRHADQLFPTRTIARGGQVLPLPPARRQITQVRFVSRGRNWDLADYLAVNRVAGLLVLKEGKTALELYQYGNTERTRWLSMSVAKSVTSTLIGAALQDGYLSSLDDPVIRYVPDLAGSAYDGVSVRDILMMSSGVQWNEKYTDPSSERRQMLEAQIAQRPGTVLDLMKRLPRAALPGTVNRYSTGETQIAGAIVRGATRRPLAQYLSERIWAKFGMESNATWWLDSANGSEIAGSGISATLRDYGRFGLFFLGGGISGGERVLPDGWSAEAGSPKIMTSGKPLNYGYFWWPVWPTQANPDPSVAFTAIGIFGQYLYLHPAEKVVIVVWSARSKPEGMAIVDDMDFFAAVVATLHQ